MVMANVEAGPNSVGHCRWKKNYPLTLWLWSGRKDLGIFMVFNFSPAPWHWDTEQPVVPESSDTPQVERAGVLCICGQEKVTGSHCAGWKEEFLKCTLAQNAGGSMKENSCKLAWEPSSTTGD